MNRLLDRLQGYVLASVRILVGMMWLANVHWKVPGDFGEVTGGGLYKYAAAGGENAPLSIYRWATNEIILPNFAAFGWFTLLSELTLAALLIFGFKSRLAALSGAAMAVPIMLSVIYYPRADEWSWAYLLMIGIHLVLAVTPSGEQLGLDGALQRGGTGKSLGLLGAVGVIIGAAGLYVARAGDFAGSKMYLLGSDAGFDNGEKLVRRWELKFVWFNPLWAILTIICALLLIAGARVSAAAIAGSLGFAVLALVALVQRTYDYARDDGQIQRIASGSNVAMWGGFALAGLLLARRNMRRVS
jgi:uncharacterized membrane protein YphA (DoxX/SURF4 family)